MSRVAYVVMTVFVATTITIPVHAEQWVASWTAAAHGPYRLRIEGCPGKKQRRVISSGALGFLSQRYQPPAPVGTEIASRV